MEYTQDKVKAYLSHIGFAARKCKPLTPETVGAADGLNYLTALQICHLASIPFESLSLHYSQDRMISLDEEVLFDKMVGSGTGRGGYCMEQNLLFGIMLRSMGFEVIPTGARVMGPAGYQGWDHQVSLVCMNDGVYLVDVGFGSSGPTRPIKLTHGNVVKWGATEAQSRLLYEDPLNRAFQGFWVMEHRNSPTEEWSPKYRFGMTEFTAQDFGVMNYATSSRRTCIFTYMVIVSKMIFDEAAGDIVGAMTLSGATVKKRIHNKSEVVIECSTEEERVAALKQHFGITLSSKEQAGIKGTVTELKG